MMKILLLNYEFPPIGGGAGVISYHHARQLAALGHQLKVITAAFEDTPEAEQIEGFDVIRLRSRRKKLFRSKPSEMLSWAFFAKRYIKQNIKEKDFDFCICNFSLPGGIPARYALKNLNLPFVLVSHGQDLPWFFPKEMFHFHLLTYFHIRKSCRKAIACVGQTEIMTERFRRLVKRKDIEKVHKIPNGCDTSFFSVKNHEKHNGNNRIFWSGRFTSQKAPVIFLQALSILKKNDFHFFVEMYGDGPMRAQIERFIDNHELESTVKLMGWRSKEEIRDAYHRSDIFVSCSRAEGMSIALLEALACGLYAIVTPVSGVAELIQENVNGCTIPYDDPESLAAEIMKSADKNKNISEDFIRKFREDWDWENIARQYEKVLKSHLTE